jgi:type II secretory pathway pseudopilin PulG
VSAGFRNRNAQRGLAMLALVAMVVMGSLYWLMSGLAQPANRTAAKRAQNAKVLQNAKAALVGYVAMNAATPGGPLITDDNPGSLPCPEAPGYIGDPVNEGKTSGSCTLPAVGRLPWRTLGIEKPLDAASEPLWYIVSPGWAKPNPGGNTVINSNTAGQITVDGVEAVAVIIAPGERLNIPASANCVARNQARSVPSPAIDFRDYLDCQNATPADLAFTSSDPVGPFNDQVLAVTPADVLPVIEAAVAKRFERELAPLIRSAYSNADGSNPNPAWASRALLPFAATFGNPTSADFKGTNGTYRGLLPLVRTYKPCSCTPAGSCECNSPPLPPLPSSPPVACTAGPADCDSNFIVFQSPNPTIGGSNVFMLNCTRNSPQNTLITCSYYVQQPLLGGPVDQAFTLSGITLSNVGRALKTFQPEAPMPGVLPSGRSLAGVINADGTATVTLTGKIDSSTLPPSFLPIVQNLLCAVSGLLSLTLGCKQGTLTIPNTIVVDHPILDASNMPYGWFVRNQWHQVSYYAVAQEIAPDGSGSCVSPAVGSSSDCLTANYSHAPRDDQNRGIIVIAGRRLSGQAPRPNGNLVDWFEGENADFSTAQAARVYTTRDPGLVINRTFNDRITVIDKNP